MSDRELLAASAFVEQGLCLLAAGIALFLWLRSRRAGSLGAPARSASERLAASITPGREIAWALGITGFACLLRTLGWDRPLNLPYWFAQPTPLYVAELWESARFWQHWRELLTLYQQTEPHLSAVMLPVAASFQWLLGPYLHLPVLVGAFWGSVAVLIAFALGRSACGPLFGLCFAGFVAASPLQLVWSRIGGIVIGASAHVLLVTWCSFVAGRRGSLGLASLAGLLAWCSLYQYYPARLSIPLAFVALACGARESASRRRTLLLAVMIATTLAAIYAIAGAGAKQTFWPEYVGYVGNKGEASGYDLLAHNLDSVAEQLAKALRVYFTSFRFDVLDETGLGWGMEHGGVCFAPVAMLGLLGLGVALVGWRRDALWLALVVLGFGVPLLSVATPRRLVVFDVGWCALASLGVLRLLETRPLRRLSARAAASLLTAGFLGLGAWSLASIGILHRAAAPLEPLTSIPFANAAWINDGRSCWRCMEAAHGFARDIAAGGFVVLFDSDPLRENRTTPGGLPLYGKLAALSAGRAESFAAFYALVRNFDVEPPRIGPIFDENKDDFAEHLIHRIEAAQPAEIVWHFELPTAWERWLASRLAAAGGETTEFSTPLSVTPGIRVRTSWAAREAAFSVLRELAALPPGPGFALHEIASSPFPGSPLALEPPRGAAPPEPAWVVRGWREIRLGDASVPLEFPGPDVIGFAASGRSDAGLDVRYLVRGGALTLHSSGGAPSLGSGLAVPRSAGPHCATWIAGRWWAVDPISGGLFVSAGARPDLPDAGWAGIARGPHDELVLAASDQHIAVFDARRGVAVRSFPARVWPSLSFVPGECAQLAAGEGWYASLDPLRSLLSLYDAEGTPLGTLSLRSQLGLSTHRVLSVAGAGSWLGIGIDVDNLVKTFEVLGLPAGAEPRAR